MEKENPPVLMDLLTFHARRGQEAAGFRVWCLTAKQGGDVTNFVMHEQSWCRGCAIVEMVWSSMNPGWSVVNNDTQRSDELLALMVGNDAPFPSIITLLKNGACAKCGKWFGGFSLPLPAMMLPPKQFDRFAHDTWRTRNRGKIR